MIVCNMTLGDRSLQLGAEDMNEIVDKIKDWQSKKDNLETFKSLGKDKKFIDDELASGWYYED